MIRYLMSIHSNVGDLVLDPFLGGGTTGIASIQEGRGFIGIEIDKNYFQVAEKRIKKEIGIEKFC